MRTRIWKTLALRTGATLQKSLTSGNSHPREVNNEQSKGDIFEGSASRIY